METTFIETKFEFEHHTERHFVPPIGREFNDVGEEGKVSDDDCGSNKISNEAVSSNATDSIEPSDDGDDGGPVSLAISDGYDGDDSDEYADACYDGPCLYQVHEDDGEAEDEGGGAGGDTRSKNYPSRRSQFYPVSDDDDEDSEQEQEYSVYSDFSVQELHEFMLQQQQQSMLDYAYSLRRYSLLETIQEETLEELLIQQQNAKLGAQNGGAGSGNAESGTSSSTEVSDNYSGVWCWGDDFADDAESVIYVPETDGDETQDRVSKHEAYDVDDMSSEETEDSIIESKLSSQSVDPCEREGSWLESDIAFVSDGDSQSDTRLLLSSPSCTDHPWRVHSKVQSPSETSKSTKSTLLWQPETGEGERFASATGMEHLADAHRSRAVPPAAQATRTDNDLSSDGSTHLVGKKGTMIACRHNRNLNNGNKSDSGERSDPTPIIDHDGYHHHHHHHARHGKQAVLQRPRLRGNKQVNEHQMSDSDLLIVFDSADIDWKSDDWMVQSGHYNKSKSMSDLRNIDYQEAARSAAEFLSWSDAIDAYLMSLATASHEHNHLYHETVSSTRNSFRNEDVDAISKTSNLPASVTNAIKTQGKWLNSNVGSSNSSEFHELTRNGMQEGVLENASPGDWKSCQRSSILGKDLPTMVQHRPVPKPAYDVSGRTGIESSPPSLLDEDELKSQIEFDTLEHLVRTAGDGAEEQITAHCSGSNGINTRDHINSEPGIVSSFTSWTPSEGALVLRRQGTNSSSRLLGVLSAPNLYYSVEEDNYGAEVETRHTPNRISPSKLRDLDEYDYSRSQSVPCLWSLENSEAVEYQKKESAHRSLEANFNFIFGSDLSCSSLKRRSYELGAKSGLSSAGQLVNRSATSNKSFDSQFNSSSDEDDDDTSGENTNEDEDAIAHSNQSLKLFPRFTPPGTLRSFRSFDTLNLAGFQKDTTDSCDDDDDDDNSLRTTTSGLELRKSHPWMDGIREEGVEEFVQAEARPSSENLSEDSGYCDSGHALPHATQGVGQQSNPPQILKPNAKSNDETDIPTKEVGPAESMTGHELKIAPVSITATDSMANVPRVIDVKKTMDDDIAAAKQTFAKCEVDDITAYQHFAAADAASEHDVDDFLQMLQVDNDDDDRKMADDRLDDLLVRDTVRRDRVHHLACHGPHTYGHSEAIGSTSVSALNEIAIIDAQHSSSDNDSEDFGTAVVPSTVVGVIGSSSNFDHLGGIMDPKNESMESHAPDDPSMVTGWNRTKSLRINDALAETEDTSGAHVAFKELTSISPLSSFKNSDASELRSISPSQATPEMHGEAERGRTHAREGTILQTQWQRFPDGMGGKEENSITELPSTLGIHGGQNGGHFNTRSLNKFHSECNEAYEIGRGQLLQPFQWNSLAPRESDSDDPIKAAIRYTGDSNNELNSGGVTIKATQKQQHMFSDAINSAYDVRSLVTVGNASILDHNEAEQHSIATTSLNSNASIELEMTNNAIFDASSSRIKIPTHGLDCENPPSSMESELKLRVRMSTAPKPSSPSSSPTLTELTASTAVHVTESLQDSEGLDNRMITIGFSDNVDNKILEICDSTESFGNTEITTEVMKKGVSLPPKMEEEEPNVCLQQRSPRQSGGGITCRQKVQVDDKNSPFGTTEAGAKELQQQQRGSFQTLSSQLSVQSQNQKSAGSTSLQERITATCSNKADVNVVWQEETSRRELTSSTSHHGNLANISAVEGLHVDCKTSVETRNHPDPYQSLQCDSLNANNFQVREELISEQSVNVGQNELNRSSVQLISSTTHDKAFVTPPNSLDRSKSEVKIVTELSLHEDQECAEKEAQWITSKNEVTVSRILKEDKFTEGLQDSATRDTQLRRELATVETNVEFETLESHRIIKQKLATSASQSNTSMASKTNKKTDFQHCHEIAAFKDENINSPKNMTQSNSKALEDSKLFAVVGISNTKHQQGASRMTAMAHPAEATGTLTPTPTGSSPMQGLPGAPRMVTMMTSKPSAPLSIPSGKPPLPPNSVHHQVPQGQTSKAQTSASCRAKIINTRKQFFAKSPQSENQTSQHGDNLPLPPPSPSNSTKCLLSSGPPTTQHTALTSKNADLFDEALEKFRQKAREGRERAARSMQDLNNLVTSSSISQSENADGQCKNVDQYWPSSTLIRTNLQQQHPEHIILQSNGDSQQRDEFQKHRNRRSSSSSCSSESTSPPPSPRSNLRRVSSTSGSAGWRESNQSIGYLETDIDTLQSREVIRVPDYQPFSNRRADKNGNKGNHSGYFTGSITKHRPFKLKTQSMFNLVETDISDHSDNRGNASEDINGHHPYRRPESPNGDLLEDPSSSPSSRAKSMEFLLKDENKMAARPPENQLMHQHPTDATTKYEHNGGYERVLSEHELRIRQSLQKLDLPEWYKKSSLSQMGSQDGFLLKRRQKESTTGGSNSATDKKIWKGRYPRWEDVRSRSTSASSLGTNTAGSGLSTPAASSGTYVNGNKSIIIPKRVTTPDWRYVKSSRESLLSSPMSPAQSTSAEVSSYFQSSLTPSATAALSRWSSSRLSTGTATTTSSRSASPTGSFRTPNKQPYLGWRSSERLAREMANSSAHSHEDNVTSDPTASQDSGGYFYRSAAERLSQGPGYYALRFGLYRTPGSETALNHDGLRKCTEATPTAESSFLNPINSPDSNPRETEDCVNDNSRKTYNGFQHLAPRSSPTSNLTSDRMEVEELVREIDKLINMNSTELADSDDTALQKQRVSAASANISMRGQPCHDSRSPRTNAIAPSNANRQKVAWMESSFVGVRPAMNSVSTPDEIHVPPHQESTERKQSLTNITLEEVLDSLLGCGPVTDDGCSTRHGQVQNNQGHHL